MILHFTEHFFFGAASQIRCHPAVGGRMYGSAGARPATVHRTVALYYSNLAQ
jgi:hypothetical protein